MDEEEGFDTASEGQVEDMLAYSQSFEEQTGRVISPTLRIENIQLPTTEEVNIQFRDTGINDDFVADNEYIHHGINGDSRMSNNVFTRHMGGAADSILKMNILTYLNSKELCILSLTSYYVNRICQSSFLWSSLYYRDFIHDEQAEDNIKNDNEINNNNSNNAALFSLFPFLATSNTNSSNRSNYT